MYDVASKNTTTIDLVDILTTQEKKHSSICGDIFYMNLKKENKDKQAMLVIENGKYVLLKDSFIEKNPTNCFPKVATYNQWQNIVKGDFIKEENGALKILKDIYFKSPSAASDIVKATSTNGRIKWKLKDGRTLGEYEA